MPPCRQGRPGIPQHTYGKDMIQTRPLRFLFTFFSCIPILLGACTSGGGNGDAGALYDEAAKLARQKRYPAALERYNAALAIDTVKGFSPVAIDALVKKGGIEYLTGEYYEAFRTFATLQRHASPSMADSLYNDMLGKKAGMYREIGLYVQAADAMAGLRSPSSWDRYEHAALLVKAGEYRKASALFRDLAASEDPAVRMAGLSGLLDCAFFKPGSAPDSADRYGEQIASVSGKVMSMAAAPEERIHVLRIAARSLLRLGEKHRRNASFLLFRALSLSQQAHLSRLEQILQFESNDAIVRKPDAYRNVIEYFGQRNMPYARMAALYMLAKSPELTDDERIEALKNGLESCRYYGIPVTAIDAVRLQREAVGELVDLLIRNGRYFELFELSEQARRYELQREVQAGIVSFRLPRGNEQLQNRIIELTREVNGLLQRKINMNEEGRGFELAAAADQAISAKSGQLIERIAEAAAIDRGAAAWLQPSVTTLRTVQKNLGPDQAMVKLFVRDSLATGLLISRREMHVSSVPVPGAKVREGLSGFQRTLSAGGELAEDPWRLWLSAVFLDPIEARLAGYGHLLVVSDLPVPIHLFGRERMLGNRLRVSFLDASGELVSYAGTSPAKIGDRKVAFFDASGMAQARAYKSAHPGDRVFLLWKPMAGQEAAALQSTLSGLIKGDASGSGLLQREARWPYLSSYGID